MYWYYNEQVHDSIHGIQFVVCDNEYLEKDTTYFLKYIKIPFAKNLFLLNSY